ncbi:MAG: DegT/DnrJ/EryC1/StrS family aminotransferase [candidate division KSB1 bacterium]|nr:DegT/DnrJ/EryC1/StrS family aminotransferase [candidate division KSB1 bacterium]MDZ7333744.1 DegT/DnrJ/EryC1/StrS family aminotransferase [candidate division KSB1 bacterium]MDZ7357047.1 DegT/DnrJ/EryC1/StrS family aminotransferase [candidate division KSB1 bacterium]MDZ7398830.1 DegT/DnrJ/EryC1/StrS family aminotransferase [candidate division KSB1 bacterium]
MSQWKIPLFDSDYDQNEIDAVVSVLRSRWLTMGEMTHQFETQFCNEIRVKHGFAVSNCTTALHLANLVLDIGPGDEVIVPSLTFVASVNSILYAGATPIFADVVSEDDWTIAPDDIERKISPRTKAILVVHYAGYPCHMDEIMTLAQQYHVAVIEDAAHAPGAWLNGRACGAFGDCGCFSFFSNKNLATGEGGMIVTNRDDLAEKIKLARSHGMTSLTLDRYKGHSYSYDVVALGYNYRPTEITSALGLIQLAKLKAKNERRKELWQYYQQQLADIPGIKIPFLHHPGSSSYHIFPILLASDLDRTRFMEFLKQHGIQTSIHYPPVHRFSYHQRYYQANHPLPKTEDIAQREVTLPLYPHLSFEQIQYITDVIKKFVMG